MADREKSALYPAVTLKECVDFIKVIDSFKSKTVSYKAVAEKYGLSSVTTKSFTQKVGTTKQFGLITTSNATIQLTDIARKILYPTTINGANIALECFKLPPLYCALIDEYNGKAIPDEKILANVLMEKYKISKAAKDSAARVFIQNADELNLIQAGVFYYTETDDSSNNIYQGESETNESNIILDNFNKKIDEFVSDKKNVEKEAEYITQTYPVESGKVAKIIIPIDSTEDDLYAIRDMLEVIMKRKFKMKLVE